MWPGVLGAASSPILPCVSAFWFLGGLPSPPGPRSLSVSGSLGQAGPQPCPISVQRPQTGLASCALVGAPAAPGFVQGTDWHALPKGSSSFSATSSMGIVGREASVTQAGSWKHS